MKAQDFDKIISFLDGLYTLDLGDQVKWHRAVLARYADHLTDDQFCELADRTHEVWRYSTGDINYITAEEIFG